MFFEYGEKEINFLKKRDKKLAQIIENAGFIERKTDDNVFKSVVYSIIGQQISSSAQEKIIARLNEALGDTTPEKICTCSAETIKSFGTSERKAKYIKNFAEKVENGEFDIDALEKLDDEQLVEKLSSIDGIGRWTAEMIMIFALGRMNVLSFGDFGIRRGLCMLYGIDNLDKKTFEKFKKRFSPYCTVASFYLWDISAGNVDLNGKRFVYDTPFGRCAITLKDEKIICVKFGKFQKTKNHSPLADEAYKQMCEYFAGKRKNFDLPLDITGSDFQKKVCREIMNIPYGETRTYGKIAQNLGCDGGARAVGNACNKNPIPIFIPCHRVIGANGKLTGFAYSLEMKEKLLELERKNK